MSGLSEVDFGTSGSSNTVTLGAGTSTVGNVTLGSTGQAGDGSITTGGTAQALFGGATPANGFEIANPDASEDLWVSQSTTAAPNGQGSIRIPPGAAYTTPDWYKPFGAVSVYGATTGHKFTAVRA